MPTNIKGGRRMAFKTVKNYNEEKFGGLFLLRNDGDSADVIFLYRNEDDVLVADTHYIKSADYSGYVHCCGIGCPACQKGIRVQSKLFIPVFNITENKVQFWDRSMRFEPQLQKDVFENYPEPSNFVFRITRHGAAGSIDTTYQIQAVAKNTYKSYEAILAANGLKNPDYYEQICRDIPASKLSEMLNSSPSDVANPNLSEYTPMPRVTTSPISETSLPEEEDVDEQMMLADLGGSAVPEDVDVPFDTDSEENSDPVF